MGCPGCGRGRGRGWRARRPAGGQRVSMGAEGYWPLDITDDEKLPIEVHGPVTQKLYLWRKPPHHSRNVDRREIAAVVKLLEEKGISKDSMASPWLDAAKAEQEQAEAKAKREARQQARAARIAQAQVETEIKETEITEV